MTQRPPTPRLTAPFPYFGGKRRVADEVWARLGVNLNVYAEPFAGSAAVFLARPGGAPKTGRETLGDADHLIVNVWRAIQKHPGDVARHACEPPHEVTLRARHRQMREQLGELKTSIEADLEYCNPRLAAWWIWGATLAAGAGWITGSPGAVVLSTSRVALTPTSRVWARLAARLAQTQILCGDWSRCVSPGRFSRAYGSRYRAGVFLDPPYANDAAVDAGRLYEHGGDAQMVADVETWALEHGADFRFRICVAGYEGMYPRLDEAVAAASPKKPSWSVMSWHAPGGFANAGDGQGRINKRRERLYFSPYCQTPATQMGLL